MSQTKTQLIDSAYESTVLTGSTNNTITTVTGAKNIQGEANLTFDGSTFSATGMSHFNVAETEVDIKSTGSGSKRSLRLLNADASADNKIGIYFGPANNVVGAGVYGISESDFTTTANRDGALGFETRKDGNWTEGMRINSSGIVSKPYQPCFAAKGAAAWVSLTTGDGKTILPTSSEIFDNGANYNNSNYRFTAPVAGKYVFFVQMYFKFDSDHGYYSNFFLKNGTEAQEAHNLWGYGNTGLYQDQTQSATYTVELAANDYVQYQLECEGDDSDFYGGHCTFSGYLLA